MDKCICDSTDWHSFQPRSAMRSAPGSCPSQFLLSDCPDSKAEISFACFCVFFFKKRIIQCVLLSIWFSCWALCPRDAFTLWSCLQIQGVTAPPFIPPSAVAGHVGHSQVGAVTDSEHTVNTRKRLSEHIRALLLVVDLGVELVGCGVHSCTYFLKWKGRVTQKGENICPPLSVVFPPTVSVTCGHSCSKNVKWKIPDIIHKF